MQPPRFVTVDDFEPVARGLLPPDIYDYYAGGAGDEWTLRENRAAFDRWVIRPRMLAGLTERDLTTEVLGTRVAFPVLVAPWAYQRLAHPEGELATARACADAGTIMVVSSTTVDYLEDVASASSGPKWWQLYLFTDRGMTADMLQRVVAAGYGAVCFTVDLPEIGRRHRDTRNAFLMPLGLPDDDRVYDPNISWADIEWIRERAPMPLLVKGIMTAEDARIALDHGVDGIVVSNHGGRQLDGVAAGVTVLPEVVEAVGGRVPVLVDGGIRRGTDVLKCLALGADAVLVGRPAVWALAAGGQEGVAEVLRILRDELDNAMALAGVRSVTEITPAFVTGA